MSDLSTSPDVRPPRPIVRPFVKLDSIDKAAEIHRRTRLGQTVAEIAASVGVSPSTIATIASAEGISTNSCQQKTWPGQDEAGISVSIDVKDPFSWPTGRLVNHHWQRLTNAAKAQREAVGAAPPVQSTPEPPAPVLGVPMPLGGWEAFPVRATAKQIIQQVASKHKIDPGDMVGPSRTRDLVRARREAYYRIRTETKLSLPQIGRRFGGRDHTTILHGIRAYQEIELGEIERRPLKRKEPVWGEGGWH